MRGTALIEKREVIAKIAFNPAEPEQMPDPRISRKEADKTKVRRLLVRGLTKEQAAEATGLSLRTIYNYAAEIRQEGAGEVARVDLFGLLGEANDEFVETQRVLSLTFFQIDPQARDGKITPAQALSYKLLYSREIIRARREHLLMYVKCGVVMPKLSDEMRLLQLIQSLTATELTWCLNASPTEFMKLLESKSGEHGATLAVA